MMDSVSWLVQDVTVPMWAVIVLLLLPGGFWASVAQEKVNEWLGGDIETHE